MKRLNNKAFRDCFPRAAAFLGGLASVLCVPFLISGYLFGVAWRGLLDGFVIGRDVE